MCLILFIYFVHICIIKINNKYYLRCRAGSGQGRAKVRSLALDPMTQCKSFAAGISRPPSTNHVVICFKSHQPQTRRQPQPQQRTQLRPQPSTVSCPPGIFSLFFFLVFYFFKFQLRRCYDNHHLNNHNTIINTNTTLTSTNPHSMCWNGNCSNSSKDSRRVASRMFFFNFLYYHTNIYFSFIYEWITAWDKQGFETNQVCYFLIIFF